MSSKLEWLETFEIGHPLIDEDHRNILDLMQRTKTAIQSGDGDLCAELLSEMLTVAKEHFAHEESILEKAEYPKLELHKHYHGELLVQAQHVKGVCEALKGNQDDLEGCFDEMASFIVDDIVKGDLLFVSYLDQKGLLKKF